MTRNKGFTLVELMVTVAVAAILLAIAMPSLESMSHSNALKSTTRDLVSTISTARSQSISTRTNVEVQPASGGWAAGWSIIYDAAALETNQEFTTGTDVAVTREGGSGAMTFLSRGGLQGGAATFSVCHAELDTGRTITVSFLGKVSVTTKGDC